MAHIIIVGAGFGGITAALDLARRVRFIPDLAVTLIDREDAQLFYPNLYELAAAEEEESAPLDLKHSITVPIREIIKGKPIEFLQGTVTAIDAEKHELKVNGKMLAYDYLILAQGSVSNFYGIPGVEQHAIPLKSVHDALRIRDRIEFAVQYHRYDPSKEYIRIAVAGGGFAGVEAAAELQKFLDFVAWKNNYPRHKVETLLIEGTNRLLPGLDDAVARDVAARLQNLSVRIQVSSFVSKVDERFIEFKNGERLGYECLIWTAGVKAASAPFVGASVPPTDRGGRIIVDKMLNPPGLPDIYVIGDQAAINDSSGRPLPGNIPQAEDQARYVAWVVSAQAAERKAEPFMCSNFGYIIPVGGKWAVVKTKYVYISGCLGYLIREFVALRYFAGIIGWRKALQLVWFYERLYSKNDQ